MKKLIAILFTATMMLVGCVKDQPTYWHCSNHTPPHTATTDQLQDYSTQKQCWGWYVVPKPADIEVDKNKLMEMTYEWAMYKTTAIVLLANYRGITQQQAKEYLEKKYNERSDDYYKFIASVEFENAWQRTLGSKSVK